MKKLELLELKQIDKKLSGLKALTFKPKEGWVKLIRSALGLSSYQLAKRFDVNQARVIQIESAEKNESVTLKTLQKVADAMDCQLVYAFVPKTSLENTIIQQARKLATKRVKRVSHSMSLEAQTNDDAIQNKQIELLTEELLQGPLKKIWSEE